MLQLTPSQSQIARDTHRFRVCCNGRRWGKTTLAILEMISKAVSAPDLKVVYIAPTYQQARDLAWQGLKKAAQAVITDVNESRLEITLTTKNGGSSAILLRGWESIETLRGMKVDFVVIDEIASMRNWDENWQEVIRPTLTDTKGEGLFISTPKGFNHFHELFCFEKKDSDYKSFHFTSYDNPNIPSEELDKARLELTEDRFAQEYMADFRKMEGLVYKEFDRTQHTFKRDYLWLPDKRTRKGIISKLLGVDFGFKNPSAMVEVWRDSDDHYWIVNEFYKTEKTNPEIIEIAKSFGCEAVYPDPAEPDRIEEMKRAGLNVREVTKDVSKGIDSIRHLLKTKRIHIGEWCFNLIQEFEHYRLKEKRQGTDEQEEPVKEMDHALDALRYVLFMQEPQKPRLSVKGRAINPYLRRS